MKLQRALMIIGMVLLLLVGLFLCADIMFTHQLYPITEAMIQKGATTESRETMRAIKRQRDTALRLHKTYDGIALGMDILCIGMLGWKLLMDSRRKKAASYL